jgi:UDP-N-acetylmuramoyl-L-alanyl-D-glutamate--2,6-diaminopimelate ligase
MKFSHLADLLKGLGVRVDFPGGSSPTDPQLQRACFDSRRVQAGDLFCALGGHEADGRRFLSEAFERGASAFLLQGDTRYGQLPHLVAAQNAPLVAGFAASHLAGNPSAQMWTGAVTGTNGKSSIVHMFEYAMNQIGKATAGGGTLGLRFDQTIAAIRNTTPSADVLHQWLGQVQEQGAVAAILEASSHGIVQHRLAGLRFDCAAWTNLTHDHLDYHLDMNKYAQAKAQLFLELDSNAVALLPARQDLRALCAASAARQLTWGLGIKGVDIRGDLVTGKPGLKLQIESCYGSGVIESALIGEHNAENLLVAAAMMCVADIDLPLACAALSTASAAPGRLERVGSDSDLHLFVDYAHTPDALVHVLEALRDTYPQQRIGVVFGAGGDRDSAKRAPMGRAVAEHCDWCVVTSDNPRTEEPQSIAEQVMQGAVDVGVPCSLIVDRREAIQTAVQSLQPGDVLLLAGKGHETYQEIHGVRHDFDDRIVLAEAVQCLT